MKSQRTSVSTPENHLTTLGLSNTQGSLEGIALATRAALMLAVVILITGCGSVPVRHVPKVSASAKGMSDLHGTPPIELKAGTTASIEAKIGSVGMGSVMGNLSVWTAATVDTISANLSARGATITAGTPKVLTITMTKAEVHSIPIVGGAKSKIVLTATTPEGLSGNYEGSDSALAPLSAVDGAVADAVKKLLSDSAVEAYLHK